MTAFLSIPPMFFLFFSIMVKVKTQTKKISITSVRGVGLLFCILTNECENEMESALVSTVSDSGNWDIIWLQFFLNTRPFTACGVIISSRMSSCVWQLFRIGDRYYNSRALSWQFVIEPRAVKWHQHRLKSDVCDCF